MRIETPVAIVAARPLRIGPAAGARRLGDAAEDVIDAEILWEEAADATAAAAPVIRRPRGLVVDALDAAVAYAGAGRPAPRRLVDLVA